MDPKFLILEMTESVLVKKRDKAGEDIEKLQSMGIDMTIDDFGTGFSSLASLDRYDFNLLKIDRFFIKRIMEDPKAAAITKSVITLAKELEIKLVAEGIENWDQLSFLRDHHCYAGQGYLFSKPLAIEQFELMLKSGKCKPTYIRKRGSMPEKDRRKYFRVHFQRLLEAKMTILEISGKKVDVGNTKVLIKNMGPGGLCFVSNIVFPVENELVLRFVTELMEKELRVKGSLVWMEEVDERIFEYGVKFEIDEDERTHLVKELSQIQIKMRKDIVFVDGSFTKASPYRYFNAKKNEDKEE
ncbi:MAG TPA: hypothetical protein DHN33_04505 [Eubacteriaceae bacterium]|nr:hypothetical protein [Eubacteriaceae bacterium]